MHDISDTNVLKCTLQVDRSCCRTERMLCTGPNESHSGVHNRYRVQRIPYLCQCPYSKFPSIQNPSPLIFVSKKHGLYGLQLGFSWAFSL
jgi:hypothetical protein